MEEKLSRVDGITIMDTDIVETILDKEDESKWSQSEPRDGRLLASLREGSFTIADRETGRMISCSFKAAAEAIADAINEAHKEDADAEKPD